MDDTWSELYMVELLHLTSIPAKLRGPRFVKECRKEDTSVPHPRERQRIRRNIIAVNRHPGLDIDEAFDKWKKSIEYSSWFYRHEMKRGDEESLLFVATISKSILFYFFIRTRLNRRGNDERPIFQGTMV